MLAEASAVPSVRCVIFASPRTSLLGQGRTYRGPVSPKPWQTMLTALSILDNTGILIFVVCCGAPSFHAAPRPQVQKFHMARGAPPGGGGMGGRPASGLSTSDERWGMQKRSSQRRAEVACRIRKNAPCRRPCGTRRHGGSQPGMVWTGILTGEHRCQQSCRQHKMGEEAQFHRTRVSQRCDRMKAGRCRHNGRMGALTLTRWRGSRRPVDSGLVRHQGEERTARRRACL